MQRYLFFFNYKVIILKKLCHLPNMVSHGKMKLVILRVVMTAICL